MKKVLLGLLVFQLVTFTANAQIQKGSVLLGGSINFANSNNDQQRTSDLGSDRNTTSNEFSFDPKIGVALENNWVIGAMVIFKTGKSIMDATTYSSTNSSKEKLTNEQNAFGVGLFARKYFPFGDKFSAFGELNSGSLWNKNSSIYEYNNGTPAESENKYTEYQTNLLAGIAYFPKNWMAIELSTNLVTFTSSNQETNTIDYSNNSFDFGLNTSAISLGVSSFLNNK
ncbi:outer membrane protein with beta-barrel domain [Algoriphagus ratkowskyi]|uniref:Outer membrane protein with beta-barrel domain n=1 Tax=Algoriphagus ratkowskyi TaxID=57028 RepID=A0A2W7R602_9BACT|nr:outer membrane beta-barrel protein [Algoriphagus ratkowskyi]PZX54586.1 outer membrane protein with beta-barrel domain [Algoriphagus ratkowskyi]TXD76902.1 PorT family protein [Algoriphagus ratkowskyi]